MIVAPVTVTGSPRLLAELRRVHTVLSDVLGPIPTVAIITAAIKDFPPTSGVHRLVVTGADVVFPGEADSSLGTDLRELEERIYREVELFVGHEVLRDLRERIHGGA